MLLILSPSKSQSLNGKTIADWSMPQLLSETEQLASILRAMDEEALAKLMDLSPRLAAQTYAQFQNMAFPFTPENSAQALSVFRGAQYKVMAVDNYGQEEFRHAQQHIAIISGLYGLLRPLDLIQPYRLEMATRLITVRGCNLYQFWGTLPTETLQKLLSQQNNPVLVDLASREYSRAIHVRQLGSPILHIDFKEQRGEKTRVIAVYAKRARGLMADWVIRHRIKEIEDLRRFARSGYRFNEKMSSQWHWIFCRPASS